MRTIFTFVMSLSCLSTYSQITFFENCSPGSIGIFPTFKDVPALMEGTDLLAGASYRYDNVVTTPFLIYAVVKVDSLANAALMELDEPGTDDDLFQPRIRPDLSTLTENRRGFVQFTIGFYYTATNKPVNISGLNFSSWNIDGHATGSNGWFREMNWVANGPELTLSAEPATDLMQVAPVNEGSNHWKRLLGSTAEHSDTLFDPAVAMVARYGPASSVTFRMGYDFKYGGVPYISPAYRRYAAKFACLNFIELAPLPLSLTYFDAKLSGPVIDINWMTANESAKHLFEIERSFDNISFEVIGNLSGQQSTTGLTSSYVYTDKDGANAGRPKAYYRLKVVDYYGDVSYSSTKMVRLDREENLFHSIKAYPNPFKEKLEFRLISRTRGEATVVICSISGQVLAHQRRLIHKGYNNMKIDGLSNLAAGTYIGRVVIDGTATQYLKLIKD